MVEKRCSHLMHCRRRRIDADPFPVLVSRTLVSVEEHFGQRIKIPSLRAFGFAEIEEVLQDVYTVFGGEGFGVKLDAPDR